MKTKLTEKWKEVKLGEVAEFINGRAFKPEEWENKGKIIIRIQDLTRSSDSPNFTTQTLDEKYLVKKGDLLISWSATLDAFIWDREEGWLNQHIFKVKIKKKVLDKKFLFYLVKNRIEDFKKQTHGSTMKHITKDRFISIKFLLPPLPIQEKIVSVLEKIKNANKLRKKANDLTQDFLRSIFLEIFGDLGRNTKNWEFKKLKDFCSDDKNAIKAGPFGSSLKKEFYVEKGYKIYGQEQVILDNLEFGNYYISKEKYKELENYKIQSGDILISLVGTYGKLSIVPNEFKPGIINPRLMKITLDRDKMNPIFFKHLFNSNYVKTNLANVSHGGTMNIINVGIVKQIYFPIPPIKLQNEFASIVKEIESVKKYQKFSEVNLNILSNVLMQKSFKGELTC